MNGPPLSGGRLLALHLGGALPLVALAAWFGLVDTLPFGEGRCASCGLEGYVIAAHVGAAVWVGAIVASLAAARRQARDGVGKPSLLTIGALAGVTLFVVASLIWHSLFNVPAFSAMIASLVLFPAAAAWWIGSAVVWWRRPPRSDREQSKRLTATLASAWVSLTLLLPAMLGWVWTSRVEWLVF